MQADIKRAEINMVHRIVHRSKIANFIQTSASPALCWLPGRPSLATQQLLEKEQEKLEAFKVCTPQLTASMTALVFAFFVGLYTT